MSNNMKNQDKVSVIIPTYNRAAYLIESLKSVLGQTCRNLEIVVVNDGSTDETKDRLETFKDCIVYLEKPNGGKSSAVNLGLRYVTGDYVWIFDDDDIALADKIEAHISLFKEDPEIGFIYTGFEVFNDEDPDCVIRTIEPLVPPEGEMLARLLSSNFICSGSVVVRKQCYDRAGHYDERLIRAQDYDMWIRLVRAGFKAGVIERPTVKIRKHEGSRGSAKDTFDISLLSEKHLWYHRIILQKAYWELPLGAYLTDASDTPENPEYDLKALLKRLWIVANSMLAEEIIRDLQFIQTHLGQNPELDLNRRERAFLSALCSYAAEKGYTEISQLSKSILRC